MKYLHKILIPIFTVIAVISLLPYILPLVNNEQFRGDFRIPYSLGEDYFLYKKYSEHVSSAERVIVIGDSVIWGHYVGDESTLTARLNSFSGAERFANLGIDGIHPAAMYGLIDSCCGSIKNRKVIVGINLLWMSSPRHDLSGDANSSINHKALLPQFSGRVPAWSPSVEERLTLFIRREIPLFLWTDHVRSTLFARNNFYRWTMDNPRENPALYFVPGSRVFTPPDAVKPDRMFPQDMAWVAMDRSVQWQYMLASIRMLREQGNSVIAVITPYNQFMLTDNSRIKRDEMIVYIQGVLAAEGITVLAPQLETREYFADLSHMTAEGYGVLAEDLMGYPEFLEFVK